ncbi:beta-1,3-glucanase family protein [Cerasicoccus frondis]|uniref:beta-1,3-glucanase family protein n=1 Tax=Cerasicoccus frondis TaxID=490090 RepID=UPI002852C4C7|nr:beta-1,3-glucanase family protein [Cerasicoccus frondis]
MHFSTQRMSLLAAIGAISTLANAATTAVTHLQVEVVNDTGFTHPPYVMLVGKEANGDALNVTVDGGQLAIAHADNATNAVTPLPVDFLPVIQDSGSNKTITSQFTGESRTVYGFDIISIGSGGFYTFFNDGSGELPYTYINNANPSDVTSNFRFDLCEFTYNTAIVSGADLTSIDAFSMPMQLELIDPDTNEVLGTRTYYKSTESILQDFATYGAENALFKLGNDNLPEPGWASTDGMSEFVRALGPNQVASKAGAPAPYPSFLSYLKELSDSSYTFTVSSNANGSNYFYPCKIQSDGNGGYQAILGDTDNPGITYPAPSVVSGTHDGAPFSFSIPSNAKVTVNFPNILQAQGTASVSGGVIQSVDITNNGAGYDTSSPPTVSFQYPRGSGAIAVADVTSGSISNVYLINGGEGYTKSENLTIEFVQSGVAAKDQATGTATLTEDGGAIQSITANNNANATYSMPSISLPAPSSGSGTTATAVASATADGSLGYFYITSGGTGYTSSDYGATFTISPSSGTDASCELVVDATSGKVTGVNVIDGGSGFSSPIITIADTAGVSAATATATVSNGAVSSISVSGGGTGYPDGTTVEITPPVYQSGPSQGKNKQSGDFFIYGATLSSESFSVAGISNSDLNKDTNIVYGAIVRDVLAALNFGYLNGVWDDTSVRWYSAAPIAYPFGGARTSTPSPSTTTGKLTSNDGYYNPWAAIMYNSSDAYGFAFSDRSGPSPLLTLPTDKTYIMRITILPDERLDSPKPWVTSTTDDTIAIQWNAVPHTTNYTVTGYKVSVKYPQGIDDVTLASTATSYTLGKQVSSFEVVNGGSGYDPSSTQITVSGGGGNGALAEPVIVDGVIVGVNLIHGGSSYESEPTVQIASRVGNGAVISTSITSPLVSDWTYTIEVSALGKQTSDSSKTVFTPAQAIQASTLTGTSSTEATTSSTVTFQQNFSWIPTAMATAGLTVSDAGEIDSIFPTSAGFGYQTAPTVTISGGASGGTATATVNSYGTPSSDAYISGLSLPVFTTQLTTIPTVVISDTTAAGYSIQPLVANGQISAYVFVTNGGPFNPSSVPTVSFKDGTTTLPTTTSATLSVGNGVIAAAPATSPGSGYTSATAQIGGVDVATLLPVIEGGKVLGVYTQSPTNPDPTNYTNGTTVTISQGSGGQSNTSASGTLVVDSEKNILGVLITDQGSGYLDNPSADFGGNGKVYYSVNGGALNIPIITVPGSGYTSSPTQSVTQSLGSGASYTANIANGSVIGYTKVSGGSGYSLPKVEMPTPAGISGITSVQATAVPVVVGGVLAEVLLTDAGAGYTTTQDLTITIQSPYGNGAVAVIDPNSITSTGALTGVTMQNTGSGYTGPLVTISPPDDFSYVSATVTDATGSVAGTMNYQNSGPKATSWTDTELTGVIGDNNQYALKVTYSSTAGGTSQTAFQNILSIPLITETNGYQFSSDSTLHGSSGPVSVSGGTITSSETGNATIAFNPEPLKAFYAVSPISGGGAGSTRTYLDWLGLYPGLTEIHPSADQDSDHFTNLEEYFHGYNPTVGNPGSNTAFELVGIAPDPSILGYTDMLMQYKVSKGVVDVADQVVWSVDMENWYDLDVYYEADVDMGSYILRTARVPINDDDTQLFLKLNLSYSE